MGKGTWLRANLVKAIHAGVLGAGTSLPGARDLADAAGVSRGTVDAVYTQLADEGFWAGGASPPDCGRHARTSAAGAGSSDLRGTAIDAGVCRTPVCSHTDAWAAASRAVLNGIAAGDLGHPDPSGHPVLRAALASWLTRTRGALATPDAIDVTGGVSHAMWLLATCWVRRHGRWNDLDPLGRGTYCARWSNVCPFGWMLPGMVPGDIPEASGAVLVTPSHQYPTGSMMPAERRRAVVDACRRAGRWLVEDDFDSHLAEPGVVPGAMQALAPDGVVLMGSL